VHFLWKSSTKAVIFFLSSIGTATLVGFGLLNYRWVFSAGRFLQSAVASGTSNPQPGGPVIRTFHLPPPSVPRVWNDASVPQQWKVELWARNGQEFCRKWRLPRHFWVLLHAVNLRHVTDGFTSPPKEGVLRIFSPEKSDGFGRVWTRDLGYQSPARLPLDHRSRYEGSNTAMKCCKMYRILHLIILVQPLEPMSQCHEHSTPQVLLICFWRTWLSIDAQPLACRFVLCGPRPHGV